MCVGVCGGDSWLSATRVGAIWDDASLDWIGTLRDCKTYSVGVHTPMPISIVQPGADTGGGSGGPGPPRRADGGGRAPSVVDFGGGPKIVRGDPYVAGGVRE